MSDILSTLPEEIQKDIHKNRPDHPITYGIITISEGKKRQIRRMMKSVHCCVIELKRISIGDIVLDKAASRRVERNISLIMLNNIKKLPAILPHHP